MQTVTLKSAPEVKAVVLAAFPAYRKQNAFLSAFGGGLSINSYWDGGSRTEFAVVELASLQRKSLPTRTHPYFDITVRGLANTENARVEKNYFQRIHVIILKREAEEASFAAQSNARFRSHLLSGMAKRTLS